MINIGITGAAGRMGVALREAASVVSGFKIAGLIERPGSDVVGTVVNGIEVVDDVRSVIESIDVLIDFTMPAHSEKNLEICADVGKPLVIGTTGLDENFMKMAREISSRIPLLISPNMSIGVNALYRILAVAAEVLFNYDAEIVEYHHRGKKDAPSATALKIAKTIFEARGMGNISQHRVVYDRCVRGGEKRSRGMIGIQAVRAGDIVGTHEVIFADNDEVIKISHSAGSRKIFAIGALRAAEILSGKSPGLYSMSDLIC